MPDNPNQDTGEAPPAESVPDHVPEETTNTEIPTNIFDEEPAPPADEATSTDLIPSIKSYEDLSLLADMDPAEVDNANLPLTPVEALHTTTPERLDVDIDSYNLLVDGMVANPLELTYDEVLTYPQFSKAVLLICPGFFVDNADWTGVQVTALLSEAEVSPDATTITFYGLDEYYGLNYSRTFPLESINADGVFLAYQVNGQLLPPEHGYPLRLVMEGSLGYEWVKWVGRVEIS
jgi:sulfoxide reductase catalytic subunit YedY